MNNECLIRAIAKTTAIAGLLFVSACLVNAAKAEPHPDAAHYSEADRAALTALVERVATPKKRRGQRRCNPRTQKLCGMPDIVVEVWHAAVDQEIALRMSGHE